MFCLGSGAFQGETATDFTISANTCTGTAIVPGATCSNLNATAAGTSSNTWTRVDEALTNAFWNTVYDIATKEFPALEMKPLEPTKDSTWINIRPLDMPTRPRGGGNVAGKQVEIARRAAVGFEHCQVLRAEMRVPSRVRSIHIPGISIHMPGILIHMPRNAHGHLVVTFPQQSDHVH
jgi:hypothetical protein